MRKTACRLRKQSDRPARNLAFLLLVAFATVLLTGCLYRGDQGPPPEQAAILSLPVMEQAVQAYRATHGVLPIHNSAPDAPRHEKYRVDLRALADGGFLAEMPAAAFERGGYYYYMIVDPEEADLSVKLYDIRVSQAVADVQRMVDGYLARTGELPLADPAAPGFYTIDFARLGMEAKQARSVYSSHYLPYLLHESGKVAVHYGLDVMLLLQQHGVEPVEGTDLRQWLVRHTPFIPVASPPYDWLDGQPVPVPE